MITFMTHWSRETSLLIEGPPFFKIAAAIIDHAANKDMGLIHIYILMDWLQYILQPYMAFYTYWL